MMLDIVWYGQVSTVDDDKGAIVQLFLNKEKSTSFCAAFLIWQLGKFMWGEG